VENQEKRYPDIPLIICQARQAGLNIDEEGY
jgi:hypothetical protein